MYTIADRERFEAAAKPMIEWLRLFGTPHSKAIIENNSAELVSGDMGIEYGPQKKADFSLPPEQPKPKKIRLRLRKKKD